MNTYRRYQDARDMAWRALLQLKEKRLPVDALSLARDQGIEIHPFIPDGKQPRLEQLLQKTGEGNCKSLKIQGRWHIFYDPRKLDESGVRFAVAHELGHFFLSHETRPLAPGVRCYQGLENEGDLLENPQELDDYAADIFAIRLLAPACVLHELHLDSQGGIMALCGMPGKAAALRAERMELLNQRDAFFTHPLERQVRDQFLPFLNEKKFPQAEETGPAEENDCPPWQENAEEKTEDKKEENAGIRPEQILPIPSGKIRKDRRIFRIPFHFRRWLIPLLAFLAVFLIWIIKKMQ